MNFIVAVALFTFAAFFGTGAHANTNPARVLPPVGPVRLPPTYDPTVLKIPKPAVVGKIVFLADFQNEKIGQWTPTKPAIGSGYFYGFEQPRTSIVGSSSTCLSKCLILAHTQEAEFSMFGFTSDLVDLAQKQRFSISIRMAIATSKIPLHYNITYGHKVSLGKVVIDNSGISFLYDDKSFPITSFPIGNISDITVTVDTVSSNIRLSVKNSSQPLAVVTVPISQKFTQPNYVTVIALNPEPTTTPTIVIIDKVEMRSFSF